MRTEQTALAASHRDPRSDEGSSPASPAQPVDEVREVDSAGVTGSSAMEWCAIVYMRLRRQAKFQVVVIEKGGSRRVVAGSAAFRAPIFGALRRRGKAQAAHELLLSRLTACGWRPVDAGGAWHEVGFVRSNVAARSTARALVTTLPEAGSARFAADECDAYGNPALLATSASFPAPRRRPIPRTKEAEAAHEELLQRLQSAGWNIVGSAGPEWFLIALERSTDEADRSNGAEALSPRAAGDAPASSTGHSIPAEDWRKRLRRGQPDVRTLLEQEDVEGLVEAAGFQDGEHALEGGPVDDRIREQAILALGELGPDAGSTAVAAAIHVSSDRVQNAAIQVLHARGEVRLLATALGSLPPTSEKSRELAFQAILEHRSSRLARVAARALVRAPGDAPLSEADGAFVHSLTRSEGNREPAKVVIRELLKAFSDDRSEVADRAEELLVGLAPTSTPSVIAELEKDRSPERAATVLGRIGDSSALQALISALEHRHEGVRVQAAGALGALRDPTAVEPLLRATRDSCLDVRAEASHALDSMGAAGVIVGMSALLRAMVMEAVASVAELPPDHRARRPVPQISAPTESWQFVEALEAASPRNISSG